MAHTTVLFGPYDPWDGLSNVKTFNRNTFENEDGAERFFKELQEIYGATIIENLNRRFLKDADHRNKFVTPNIMSYMRHKNYEDHTPDTDKSQRRTKKGAHVIIEHALEPETTVKYAFSLHCRIMDAFTIDYLEDQQQKKAEREKALAMSIEEIIANMGRTDADADADDVDESISWIRIENVNIQVEKNSPDFYLHYFDKEADRAQSRNISEMNQWLLDWIEESSLSNVVPIIAIKRNDGILEEYGLASFKQENVQTIELGRSTTSKRKLSGVSEDQQHSFNTIVNHFVNLMHKCDKKNLPPFNKQILNFFRQNAKGRPFDVVDALEDEERREMLKNIFIALNPDKIKPWASDLPNYDATKSNDDFATYRSIFRAPKRHKKMKGFLANLEVYGDTFMFGQETHGTTIVNVVNTYSMPPIRHNIRLAEKIEIKTETKTKIITKTKNILKIWKNESGIYNIFVPFRQSYFGDILDLGTRLRETSSEEHSEDAEIEAWKKAAATKIGSPRTLMDTDITAELSDELENVTAESDSDSDEDSSFDIMQSMYIARTGDLDATKTEHDEAASGDDTNTEHDEAAGGDDTNTEHDETPGDDTNLLDAMVFDFVHRDKEDEKDEEDEEDEKDDLMDIELTKEVLSSTFRDRMANFWANKHDVLDYLRQSGKIFMIQTPLQQLFLFEEFFEHKEEMETQKEKKIRDFLLAGIETEQGNDAAKRLVEILIEKIKFFKRARDDAKKNEIKNVITTYLQLLRSKYQSNLRNLYETGHIVFDPHDLSVIDAALKQIIAGEDVFEHIKVEFDASDFVDDLPLVVDSLREDMEEQNFRKRYYASDTKLLEKEDEQQVNVAHKTFEALRDTPISLEQLTDLEHIEEIKAPEASEASKNEPSELLVHVEVEYHAKNTEVSMEFEMKLSDTLKMLVSLIDNYDQDVKTSPETHDDDVARTKISVQDTDLFILDGKKITDRTITLHQLVRDGRDVRDVRDGDDHIALQLISPSVASKALIHSSKIKQIAYAHVIQSVETFKEKKDVQLIALTTNLDKVVSSLKRMEPITKIRASLLLPVQNGRMDEHLRKIATFLILAFEEQEIPIIEWSLVELCVNWLCEVIEKNNVDDYDANEFKDIHRTLDRILYKREKSEKNPYEETPGQSEIPQLKKNVRRKGAFGYIQPGLYEIVNLIQYYIETAST